MLNIDDWVWERSQYWWNRLNMAHHTLYEIPEITISDRPSRAAGWCHVKNGKLEITLYEHYINTEKEKYEQTIGHELAHAHNYCHYHKMGHGYLWKQTMLKIGLKPDRCHNFKSPNDQNIICQCGSNLRIGKTQLKRMSAGHMGYICLKCRRKISCINGVINLSY